MASDIRKKIFDHVGLHVSTTMDIINRDVILIDSIISDIYFCISKGSKILVCGNGGSTAQSEHIVAELVGYFNGIEMAIPAICLNNPSILTALSNDNKYENCFSQYVKALGKPDDYLIALSTSGQSKNITNAIIQAKKQNLKILLITGNQYEKELRKYCNNIISINSHNTQIIQEITLIYIHIICKLLSEMITE